MPDLESSFAPQLLSQESRERHRESYASSKPYRHAVVDGLINDELLRKARNEIVEELRFTEKETDIYKVNQTGDLANLDGLPEAERYRLEGVLQVRNAIYSKQFRQWLMAVTGCGPLSEKKKDMSINDYTNGCHLLNHDDVISTRRLSYILYLPDPAEPWKPEWGGALELYPVEGKHVPSNTPSVVIPPKWNQYTFFAVQPGHSFHSVEEVAHPTKSRLSISGWFHRPQPEEEGYDEADEKREEQERKDHASAEGLLSKEFDAEFTPYSDSLDAPLPGSDLSAEDRKFLAFFLNPLYLQRPNQAALFDRFGDDSHILLADFLNKDFASALEKALKATDGRDQLRWWELDGGREKASVPSHSTGVEGAWTIQGPPHRQRFLALGEASTPAKENPALPASSASEMETDALIEALKGKLLPSPAFRHFLANISQLVPIGARPVQARRFRPGLDYTLARSDEEAVLDVVLDLTPDVGRMAVEAAGVSAPRGLAGKAKKAKTNGAGKTSKIGPKAAKALKEAWQSGESGGWECYMAPNDDESDDPAVYGSGSKREEAESGQGSSGKVNGSVDKEEEDEEEEEEEPVEMELDEDDDGEEEDEEDESGVLLNLTPTFNTLSLVLRDQKVMRFVKYLSASAGGSRWDISAEFEVGAAVVEE